MPIKRQEVNRPFKTVFADIKTNTDKCLNVTAIGSTPGTYGPVVESIPYHARSRMVGDKAGETVFQQNKRATGQMPEGGYFVMIMDTERSLRCQTDPGLPGSSSYACLNSPSAAIVSCAASLAPTHHWRLLQRLAAGILVPD